MNKQSLALVIASISVAIIAIIVAIICLISAKSNKNTTEQSSSVKTATSQQFTTTVTEQETTVETTTTAKEYKFETPVIESCTLAESFGIKTEITGVEYNTFNGLTLKLKVTNNSIRNIYVRSSGIVVNELVYDCNYSTDNIDIGQTGSLDVNISSDWLEELGISKINSMYINFTVCNTDDYTPIDNYDRIKINIKNSENGVDTYKYNDTNSIPLCNKGDIEIRATSYHIAKDGELSLIIWVNNEAETDCTVAVSGLSINHVALHEGQSSYIESCIVLGKSMTKFIIDTELTDINEFESALIQFNIISYDGGDILDTDVGTIEKAQLSILDK